VRKRLFHARLWTGRWTVFCAAVLLTAAFSCAGQAREQKSSAQSGASAALPAQSPAPAAQAAQNDGQAQAKPVRNSDRRKAAKLYLAASKLFAKEQFEEAMRGYQRASALNPNGNYALAAEVARNHAVMALIQAAAKDRMRGDEAAARAALAHALELDPKNIQVSQHLYELGDDALLGQTKPLYEQGAETAGEGVELAPERGVHSFHLHISQRQILQQVFKAYGIQTTLDESVSTLPARLDVDNVNFETAAQILELLTKTFYVPLDAHRALVARDSNENRQKFQRLETETVYLPGLSATELTDVVNLAKNVFESPQAMANATSGTITLRAPRKALNAFNATMRALLDGRSQVLLDVRVIQLAHNRTRNTGIQPMQSVSAYNLYTEEQSILNDNSALVQEIISSGLASASDYLTIIGILIASGNVSSSLFSNGIALFGGGLTSSALAPGSVTANLKLNSSQTRQLDQMQLRLGDGEAATIRSGERYPIQTSSYSSLDSSISGIAGLTSAGTSSSLTALLASYGSSSSAIPQVEYQDLGLTLKATPKVMRNGDVALTLDMKIDALSGSSLSGNPILNNRLYSGVVTLKQGETVEVISEISKSESNAISGTPGISEIPGMSNLTDKDADKDYASLLIVMTPHVVRGIQASGHTPMMRIERGQQKH
jgi:general secretion pathway protein D